MLKNAKKMNDREIDEKMLMARVEDKWRMKNVQNKGQRVKQRKTTAPLEYNKNKQALLSKFNVKSLSKFFF
jgi:hypothetical protein